MECVSCQADIHEGSKFCDECGAPVRVRCPSCGSENRPSAKFCSECGAKLSRAGEPASPTFARSPAVTSIFSAERRQLTVMFCDLVGSTALSARLDPEVLRALIAAYHKCVAEVVGRFEGFIAKYMGDGVLVYFGYPQAHEDDAERAVRAGLAVVNAVARLTAASGKLQVRIGIATGPVIVGDLIGMGAAQEQSVVGETPNLAARLQIVAEPDTVVVAPNTRRLLGHVFECRELRAVQIRGLADPISAWQVLHENVVESQLEACRAEQVPLVGREEEIELLLRRWQQTREGEGQIVLISGEPGIGKSRLTAALLERLAAEPHTRLRYFCSPYGTGSPLHPFVRQLERAAKFEPEDSPDTKLDKLEALIAPSSDNPQEVVPLLAEMLSIPGLRRSQPLDLSPAQKKEKTLAALAAQLQSLAKRRPALVIFENLHWADPTSLELLERIIEPVESLPVLLVVTFRSDLQLPWIGLAHVTTLQLRRLSRSEGGVMIQRLTRGKPLPEQVTHEIIERTDGVPLFIEELTRAVLESGLLREEVDRYVLGSPLRPLEMPISLEGSLMARLDSLGDVKDIAQIGAVIGREFTYELLAVMAGRSEPELGKALDRLVDAGLVLRRGAPPRATFRFKHTLVQDVAYSTLLRNKREDLHRQIAQAMLESFPEMVEAQPELLAHHFTRAGQAEKAAEYWQRAGQRALDRLAYREAAAHFRSALDGLAALPQTRATDETELRAQLALAAAQTAASGYASPTAGQALARAQVLSERSSAPRSAETPLKRT